MNKETHEQEIEVELLDPEDLEKQEDDIDLPEIALDGDLIEALYQEQRQEQRADEADDYAEKESTTRTNGGAPVSEEDVRRAAEAAEEGRPEKIVLPDMDATVEIEVPEKIVLNEAEAIGAEDAAEKGVDDKTGIAEIMTAGSMAAEGSGSMAAAAGTAKEVNADSTAEAGMPAKGTAGSDAAEKGTVAEGATGSGVASKRAAGESAENPNEESLTAEKPSADMSTDEVDELDEPGGQGSAAGNASDEETEKKPKKKKSIFRKVLKGILIAFEVLILALIVYVVAIIVQADSTTDLLSRLSQSLLGKTVLSVMIEEEYESNVQETIDSEQISTNEGLDVTPYTLEGDYTSFVIFGVDARGDEFDSGTNSDTIIIVTVQNETGRVRMASIYRDTYLQIESSNGDVHYAKANSAYSSGGAVRAINMLNTNFDLALEDYVVVNFTGVADIIDELGGLDITLSEGEVQQLNYHLAGSIEATGLTASKISSAGLNHLNGVQALTYARIRKTAFTDPETGEEYNNDYGRTKRQQYVISLLAAKAKQATVSELTSIVNRIFSYNTDEEKVIGTTYSFNEIVSMIPLALDFTLDGGEGYPDNKTTMVMSDLNGADCVIATDLVSDVSALHAYLYDEEDYSPTATVRNIAETILERAAAYGTED